jgi:toxin FitB
LDERLSDGCECSDGVQSADARVKHWLETSERQSQHVSVMTLAEIQKGIEMLAKGKRRVQLEQWLRQDLEAWFSGRILPVDR